MAINIRRPGVWIPAVAGGALLLLIVIRIIQASTPEEPSPTVEEIRAGQGVPVAVITVDEGPVAVWREFNGTVSGAQEAVVRARTGDEIVSVAAQVGRRVGRGTVLVQQAGQGTAARVRQAEAARRQAESTVTRLRPLHEAGAISDQEWESALTQLELARADVAAARDVLTLSSPLAGTVTEVTARPGMIPSPGDALVRVADLSELVVYARVGAADAAVIRQGQSARVPGTPAVGEVRRVALQADPETRLVEVQVGFPPGAGLIPGTLATVEIETASSERTVRVPRAAISGGYAWVIGDDDRAARRAVDTGLASRDFVEILSGLQPGERVVVEGGSLLSDGAAVRVVDDRE